VADGSRFTETLAEEIAEWARVRETATTPKGSERASATVQLIGCSSSVAAAAQW